MDGPFWSFRPSLPLRSFSVGVATCTTQRTCMRCRKSTQMVFLIVHSEMKTCKSTRQWHGDSLRCESSHLYQTASHPIVSQKTNGRRHVTQVLESTGFGSLHISIDRPRERRAVFSFSKNDGGRRRPFLLPIQRQMEGGM